MSNDSITIKKPFDAHVHFRRGAMLRAVAPISAQKFSAAIVMPNTDPPIETIEQAAEYKKEILAAFPAGNTFNPLMTFYLTKNLKPEEIEKGLSNGVYAVKYYPYGATTNSQWGFRDILEAKELLSEMERAGMPLLLHGEVHVDESENEVDPYQGEKQFIESVFPRLLEQYSDLKISLEHLSTKIAAEFLEKNGETGKLVATVTPHHLLYAREDVEDKPLLRCKPLIKSASDREKVRGLVAEGLPFLSAGTDSAPHPESKKFASPAAFGVFNSPVAIELYTQVFDELNALDKLEEFLSINGPRFFGIEPSKETITLVKNDWQVTEPVVTDEGVNVWPIAHKEHGLGNETIHWQIAI
ncbi:hypothetical protein A2763_04145 [Candidatus Kaiserbacteria bacterium RIFCSPHIGHO2_01_FULL_54_36]|uniref:Dihydroorotase n=1 Tax=Candidatus Kaiserbacteria bacterium RIFCSPHIGHO2_01_FULL_54_36 TaxID=1798482 RepID=A0A1F6CK12_9BACT|nr:MAG: hypothetical protein A2763_04145 [Candidatus Kaiserbacteria bacterium RIFCSPHIGHO2_01_FULL_54_36]OGG75668.1 MAG: hypothetical protein A3A41_00955 [Candidatus Kaiserbacteria bacterium RIFCSPLOWO2_01_FULL_54_22]